MLLCLCLLENQWWKILWKVVAFSFKNKHIDMVPLEIIVQIRETVYLLQYLPGISVYTEQNSIQFI